MLKDKKVLLGITGGIAACKSPEILRLLQEAGAEVRVVMTQGATAFVTPLTLQALSGHPVYQMLMDAESEAAMSHIDLARWADLILIAPATAHFIAKLAHGLADDLLTTLCLATQAPIIVSPAMNRYMWSNPATQYNIHQLTERQIQIIGPASGIQACGEIGPGRMMEPAEITAIINLFCNKSQALAGKKFIITAGPTQEAIDPVRYLSNYSSGKMGYALAEVAARQGATVTLISGPTALACPWGVTRIDVTTAQQMHEAALQLAPKCDVFIAVAAVADYRVAQIQPQKIKKNNQTLHLELEPNPDILLAVSQLKSRPIVIGFAAETENLMENARQKLVQKQLDMIVANAVGKARGFQQDENELFIITADNEVQKLSRASKKQLAKKFIEFLMAYIKDKEVVNII